MAYNPSSSSLSLLNPFRRGNRNPFRRASRPNNSNNSPALPINLIPPYPTRQTLTPPTGEELANLPVEVLPIRMQEGWVRHRDRAFYLSWAPGVVGRLGYGYKECLESLAVRAGFRMDLVHVRLDGDFATESPLLGYEGWGFDEHFPVSFPELERFAMVYITWEFHCVRGVPTTKTARIWRKGDLPAIVFM